MRGDMKGVIKGYRRSGDAHRRTWRYIYAYRHIELREATHTDTQVYRDIYASGDTHGYASRYTRIYKTQNFHIYPDTVLRTSM